MNNRRELDRRAPKKETAGDSADENVWGNGEKDEAAPPKGKPVGRVTRPDQRKNDSSDDGW